MSFVTSILRLRDDHQTNENSLNHQTKLTWSSDKTRSIIRQNSLDHQTKLNWSSGKTRSIIRQNSLDYQTKLTRSSDKTHSIIRWNSVDHQTKLTRSSDKTHSIIRQNSLDHQTNSLDHQTKLSFSFSFFFFRWSTIMSRETWETETLCLLVVIVMARSPQCLDFPLGVEHCLCGRLRTTCWKNILTLPFPVHSIIHSYYMF